MARASYKGLESHRWPDLEAAVLLSVFLTTQAPWSDPTSAGDGRAERETRTRRVEPSRVVRTSSSVSRSAGTDMICQPNLSDNYTPYYVQ